MSQKQLIRKKFREAVFKRDQYTCQICGTKYSLAESEPDLQIINAHHITDRNLLENGGYTVFNGITVCDEKGQFPGPVSCHMLVEAYHLADGNLELIKNIPKKYLPESLYCKIGSSFELAKIRSKQLK